MVRSILVIATIYAQLLLAGCYDRFYGPTIQSTMKEDIIVKIYYKNGKVNAGTWKPCMTAFVGIENNPVIKIEIFSKEKIIHALNRTVINQFIEQIDNIQESAVIRIERNKVHVVTATDGLGFDTAKCVKGKKVTMNTLLK